MIEIEIKHNGKPLKRVTVAHWNDSLITSKVEYVSNGCVKLTNRTIIVDPKDRRVTELEMAGILLGELK